MIMFTVHGKPQGKGRPRVTSHGTYTPEKTKQYEELVRWCWRADSGKSIYILEFVEKWEAMGVDHYEVVA